MALHIAAWIVLLLVSANTLVLEFSGLSGLRLLAFGSYRLQRQRSAVPAPGNDTAATAGAVAAEAAAVAAGYRAKRGIASGVDSLDDIAALAPSVSWYYDWGTLPDNVTGEVAMAAGMEFVPMQWGRWGIQNLDRQLGLMSPRPAALLGFNEPTHIGQANMMPQLAAAMWPTLEVAAAKYSLRLGSPSAAGCGAWCTYGDPFDWWRDFFGNCSAMYTEGCRVDFMAMHLYTCNLNAFKRDIQKTHRLFGRPIWVTEFNCPNAGGPVARQVQYTRQALAYLNNEPAVERYAWFTSRGYGGSDPTMSLLGNGNSNLTWLGKVYTNDSSLAPATALTAQRVPLRIRRSIASPPK